MGDEILRFVAVRSARPRAWDAWLQVRTETIYPDVPDQVAAKQDHQGNGSDAAEQLAEGIEQLAQQVSQKLPPTVEDIRNALSLKNVDDDAALVRTDKYKRLREGIAAKIYADRFDTLPRTQLLICGAVERLAATRGREAGQFELADWLDRAVIVDDRDVARRPVGSQKRLTGGNTSGTGFSLSNLMTTMSGFVAARRLSTAVVRPGQARNAQSSLFERVPQDALARPPAIGVLHTVERDLCGYRSKELYTIQNILRGEQKQFIERTQELDETETEMLTEQSRAESRSVDTREASEMRTETEKAAQSDSRFSASLELEAQYPPFVRLTTNVGLESSSTSSERNRSVSSVAQEIVTKAAKVVADRQLERIRNVKRREHETYSKHSFSRVGKDDDARGVYLFVEAAWTAQTKEHDESSLLIELLLPKPGERVRNELADRPRYPDLGPPPKFPEVEVFAGIPGLVPLVLARARGTRQRLSPKLITRSNWADLCQEYEVQAPPPPPAAAAEYSTGIKSSATDDEPQNHVSFEVIEKMAIPDDYRADALSIVIHSWNRFGQNHDFRVSVAAGSVNFPPWFETDGTFSSIQYQSYLEGVVPVAVMTDLARGFSGTLTVKCKLKEEAFERWQVSVFNRILAKYQDDLDEYNGKVVAAQQREADQPPRSMRSADARELIHGEIKKWCIGLMEGANYPVSWNGIGLPTSESVNWGGVDTARLNAISSRIMFLEHAFDWRRLQFVPLGALWNESGYWDDLLFFEAPDPDLRSFLVAGAVRVVIPARDNFEDAVLRYLRSGEIWDGRKVPIPGDDLYVSIAVELAESLKQAEGGDPVDQPMHYYLPTAHNILGDLPLCAHE